LGLDLAAAFLHFFWGLWSSWLPASTEVAGKI
jgi:hypothetical protein